MGDRKKRPSRRLVMNGGFIMDIRALICKSELKMILSSSIYAAGNQLNISPYKIGQSIKDIYRSTLLEIEIVVASEQWNV